MTITTCPACGERPPGAACFCPSCGGPLTGPEAQPATVHRTPPQLLGRTAPGFHAMGAWFRAFWATVRLRRRQRQLHRELRARVTQLGEAVYSDDDALAETLKAEARRLAGELERAQDAAARELLAVQPTRVLPPQ